MQEDYVAGQNRGSGETTSSSRLVTGDVDNQNADEGKWGFIKEESLVEVKDEESLSEGLEEKFYPPEDVLSGQSIIDGLKTEGESDDMLANSPQKAVKPPVMKRRKKRKRVALPTEYPCNSCEYITTQPSHLMYHKRIHSGEKPLACQFCDYRATHPTTLTRHLRRHTGEKPYACSDCDFKSAQPASLIAHRRSHTGERPFPCPSCSYRGRDPRALQDHLITHTGERPYACDVCKYKFARRSALRRHIRLKHPDALPSLDCSTHNFREGRLASSQPWQANIIDWSPTAMPRRSVQQSKPQRKQQKIRALRIDVESSDEEDTDEENYEPDYYSSIEDREFVPGFLPVIDTSTVSKRPKRNINAPKKLDL